MKHAAILFVGAALLATPAFAQAASDSTTAAMPSGTNSQMATADSTSSNTSASASSDATPAALASVPDTKKAYKASSRARDFAKEAQTTKELNQQVASAGGIPAQQ